MSELTERVADANRHYAEWRKGGAVDYMIRCEGRWHRAAINLWPDLLAEVEQLRGGPPELWECPDCAFAMDAAHRDEGGGYTCPNCEGIALRAERDAALAREAALREALTDLLPAADAIEAAGTCLSRAQGCTCYCCTEALPHIEGYLCVASHVQALAERQAAPSAAVLRTVAAVAWAAAEGARRAHQPCPVCQMGGSVNCAEMGRLRDGERDTWRAYRAACAGKGEDDAK